MRFANLSVSDMFHISLYENGAFVTQIGGEVRTVADASAQIQKAMSGIKGEAIPGYVGFRFDRNGTSCAILATDDFGMLIKEITPNNQ